MKKYIITSILSIAFFACNSEAELKQIQKVNSLEQRLDSTQIKLENADSSTVKEMTTNFFDNKAFIEKSYDDTIDNETIRFIDKYLRLKKACGLIKNSYGKTYQEVLGTQERLDNLKRDIKEGLIEESKFHQYYQLESNNVATIEESSHKLFRVLESFTSTYNEMNPKIDSLINESERKAAIKAE